MKKIILIIIIILVSFLLYNNIIKSEIITDNNLIRLRVIPNSNSITDQSMKKLVVSYLEDNIYPLVNNNSSTNEVRNIMINNLDKIDNDIKQIFKDNNYEEKFTISYGYNYFPQKEYNNEIYDEGYYESLVISIGNADGDNFWCLLFPNFCMLENTDNENVKYELALLKLFK